MTKKVLGAAALAAVAACGLTSCDGNTGKYDKTLDIAVVYKSDQGPSYQQATSFDVDGVTYTKGDLLPMWEVLEDKFQVNINDAGDYQQNSTEKAAQAFIDKGNKGVNGENVELLMATLNQITTLATATGGSQLVSLSDLMEAGKMPNYKKYLDEHPSVKAQLQQADGNIYSAVYFDGVDDIEKYFMIAGAYVKKLLDSDTGVTYDTTYKAGNELKIGTYQPYNTDLEYSALLLSQDETKAVSIDIKLNGNAVEKQNALGTKNGATLVEVLKKHIDENYMNLTYPGTTTKIYSKRSDVFLSNKALYNTDDFVALWRCIKANPQLLCGKDSIDVMTPRSNDSNRQRQVLSLAQMFGMRGTDGEKERLYFDENGELQDARTTDESYDAINKVHELYAEGLILQNYNGTAGQSSTYRDSKLADGSAAVYYDYAQSTAAAIPANMVDKLQLQVVEPPVVKWAATEKDGEDLPEYYHFTEDARSLKSGAWGIPSSADADLIDTAAAIIDYFYCDEGADLCDFGPNTTTYRKAVTEYDANGNRVDKDPDSLNDGVGVYKGETYVVVADRIFDQITWMNEDFGTSGGWFEYYTRFVGNSLGFGNIRSSGLEYQFVEETYMKPSMTEVAKAVGAEAYLICDTKAHEGGDLFFQCVPTSFPLTEDQQTQANQIQSTALYEKWQENSGNKTCGYTDLIKEGVSSTDLSTYQGFYETFNTRYLATYRAAYKTMMER